MIARHGNGAGGTAGTAIKCLEAGRCNRQEEPMPSGVLGGSGAAKPGGNHW